MPQMRSLGSFVPTPNLAEAYLGGVNAAGRENELQVNTQMERQKLQQQMAMAEMEAASRASALQQQALRQAQELEVQKAYQQQQIGLAERELSMKEQGQNEELQRAAATSGARMAMQRQVEELIRGGAKPAEAFTRALVSHGPSAEVPGTAYSDVIQNQTAAQIPGNIGGVSKAEGDLGVRGFNTFRSGPNSLQLVPPPVARVPEDVPGDPSKYSFGAALHDKPATRDANKLEKEAEALKKEIRSAKFAAHRASVSKSKDPEARLSLGDKSRIKEYEDQLAEIAKIQSQVSELRSSLTNAPAAAPPGAGGSPKRLKYNPATRRLE